MDWVSTLGWTSIRAPSCFQSSLPTPSCRASQDKRTHCKFSSTITFSLVSECILGAVTISFRLYDHCRHHMSA